MPKTAKSFAAKLHDCLDDLGLPTPIRERTIVFSKMLNIPKQQAFSILEGHLFPDDQLLERISAELEVDREWLLDDDN